jgi:hypothetical protein
MSYDAPIDNPYNQNSNDNTQETLPLDEVLRRAIQAELMKARVMIPVKVIKINACQNVDIQPLLKTRYIDGEVKDMPPIQQVPISMSAGLDYSIKLPVDVGDFGYAMFSDRSLDNYLAGNGEIVDPSSARNHNISDAVFVPGLVPFAKQLTDLSTDLIITNGKAVFKIQKAGKYVITNGTNELMDILSQISEQLKTLSGTISTDTVNTIFGPTPLNAALTYATIKTTVETLKTKLDTLKGA